LQRAPGSKPIFALLGIEQYPFQEEIGSRGYVKMETNLVNELWDNRLPYIDAGRLLKLRPLLRKETVFTMRGKEFVAVIIMGLLCTVISGCGGDDDKPIYDTETEGDRELSGEGSTYDIGGTAEAPDDSLQQEYKSPFGPPEIKPISWSSSIPSALSRAKPGSGKKVLVWFTSSSCAECSRAEAETFRSEVVLREAGKYVWVRFNVDANREKAEYYIKDNNPPALVWLFAEGNSYHELYSGFDDPDFIAQKLIDWH
jgi:hypothetical protein